VWADIYILKTKSGREDKKESERKKNPISTKLRVTLPAAARPKPNKFLTIRGLYFVIVG
jgi:hypothetical protein